MPLARVNVTWSNFPGAPGLSTLFLENPPTQAQIDSVRTFFNAFNALVPSGLTTQVPSTGDVINEVDGKIVDSWTVGTTPLPSAGIGTGSYAGNAGAVVNWLATGIVNGRRVRGRTFLVPLVQTAYDTQGSLASASITLISNAAQAYIAGADFAGRVWARPYVDPKGVNPSRPGSSHQITKSRVPDLAVSLRSRRI